MKNKKYRGVDVVTKKKVYGDFRMLGDLPLIEVEQGSVLVEEGSVEKLVVDKDGREVWELLAS